MLQHLGSLVRPSNKVSTITRDKSGIYNYKKKKKAALSSFHETDEDQSEQLNVDLSDMRDSLLPGQFPNGIGSQIAKKVESQESQRQTNYLNIPHDIYDRDETPLMISQNSAQIWASRKEIQTLT